MTETIDTFYAKLGRAAARLDYLQKTGKNAHFKYSFVTEAHVKEKVKAALTAEGLVLSSVMYTPVGTCDGKSATLQCTVCISDGVYKDQAVFQGIGSGTDSSDKAPMKACAAALKYALTSGFLIPTGDDPENEEEETDRPTEAPKSEPVGSTRAGMSESMWIDRIKTAPNVEALISLKAGITDLRAKDEAAFNRVVEVYRARNKELTK